MNLATENELSEMTVLPRAVHEFTVEKEVKLCKNVLLASKNCDSDLHVVLVPLIRKDAIICQ